MIAKENLVELNELMKILGYSDERSVKKWCKRNIIPLFKAGSKIYTLSHYLTQYIDNQLVIFAKANSLKPEDMKIKISAEKISVANEDAESTKLNETEQHSEVTKKFLNKIKLI